MPRGTLRHLDSRDFFFSQPHYYFSYSSIAFFCCFVLFQYCCCHAQVFGRTLLREFFISYSHTELYLFFSRGEIVRVLTDASTVKNQLNETYFHQYWHTSTVGQWGRSSCTILAHVSVRQVLVYHTGTRLSGSVGRSSCTILAHVSVGQVILYHMWCKSQLKC